MLQSCAAPDCRVLTSYWGEADNFFLKKGKCSQFLLFVVIFYKVVINTELLNTEPLLLGETQG